jgi:hypothetical protein
LAHHLQANTSHKGKKNAKNAKKKKTLHPVATETHVLMQQLHPKEERKEKEGEVRRKKVETHCEKPTHGRPRSGHPPRPSAGSHWRFSLVFPSSGFGFFFGF